MGSPCSVLSVASGSRARLAGSSTAKTISTYLISLSGVTLSLSITPSHVLDTAQNVSTSHNGRLLSGCINGRIRLGGYSMSRDTCRKTSRALIVPSQFDAHMVLHALRYLSQNIYGPTSKSVTVSTCPVWATILSNNVPSSSLCSVSVAMPRTTASFNKSGPRCRSRLSEGAANASSGNTTAG